MASPEKIQKKTNNPFVESIPIWGTPERADASWQKIEAGDVVLFYTGNKQYKYAA